MNLGFLTGSVTGMEISQSGVACALMSGSVATSVLEKVSFRPFLPDMLRISHRDPHVQHPELFVDRLREAHSELGVKEPRVSLVLPDSSGRIMLFDLEERWKSKEEAVDMIRWKLKKNIPLEMSDLHLDFQLLERDEDGESSVMVAIISRRVVQQYEELLDQAGLQADRIDFTTLNLLKAFNHYVTKDLNAAFFSFYGQSLGVMIFSDGIPSFYRSKHLPGSVAGDNRVYMEVNSSISAYRQRWPERIPGKVFCMAPPEYLSEFANMTAELSGAEATALEVRNIVKPGNMAPADQNILYPFTAPIGAAIGRL